MLLDVLNETYQEIRDKHVQSTRLIEEHMRAVEQEKTALAIAEENAAIARQNDEQITTKINELRIYCNAFEAPLQVLMNKIASLTAEQEEAYRKRVATGDIVKRCKETFKTAETRKSMEEATRAQLYKGAQEVLEHIQKVRDQSSK